MIKSIRKIENLHIALWLIKDTCWVMNFKILGLIMIFPTLSVAIYLTYLFKNIKSELYHNLAICFWILANTTWMVGEFYFKDAFRPVAEIFFFIGLGIVAFYYLFLLVNRNKAINNAEIIALKPEDNKQKIKEIKV